MDYLQLMYVLGLCSCFSYAKGEIVQFNTTQSVYNMGDTVTLTCFVKSDWLRVSVGRNGYALGSCYSKNYGCVPTADMQDDHGNYELKLEKSLPMLVIKNVTRDDDGANFTCHWITYTATTSFAVTDEHVQLEATRTIFNVGDTVTLACNVRSSWLTVSFGRKNSVLGYCSTIMNGCYPTADIRDRYSNYEIKLEKSRPMLVIKNVTIDENEAEFTCQWTSYTDTISFAVNGEHVQFNTTKPKYNIGDTVTLTCYVKSDWLRVSVGRNGNDLGNCFTKNNSCVPTAGIQNRYGNYELKLEKSHPMLVIKNVTRDDHGADFTCHWTTYTATTSFAVYDEHVQLEASRTIYNVGDTVTLTCNVRSDWLVVSFGRKKSFLGDCFTLMNGCYPTADIQDRYGNYELKLENSHPMLVIKNVTVDEDGAVFSCQWTSYTDTISFAVNGEAVTTLPMHKENMPDSSMVLVSVLAGVAVLVIVSVIVGIVRQPVLCRHIVEGFIDWRGRTQKHVHAPINADTVRTRDTGQECETTTNTFSGIGKNMSSLGPNCDDNCNYQKQLDRQMEDIHVPNVHGTECVTPFLEKRIDNQVHIENGV